MSFTGDHVEPQVLYDLVSGVLDPEESSTVKRHLDNCGRCRGEFALADSFLKESGDPVLDLARQNRIRPVADTPALIPARGARLAIRVSLLAAGLALIAFGIVPMMKSGSLDLESDGQIRSSAMEERMTPRTERVDSGWNVSWDLLDGDVGETSVMVLDPAGQVVMSTEVQNRTHMLLDTVLDSLGIDPARCYVRIETRYDDGTRQVSNPVALPAAKNPAYR